MFKPKTKFDSVTSLVIAIIFIFASISNMAVYADEGTRSDEKTHYEILKFASSSDKISGDYEWATLGSKSTTGASSYNTKYSSCTDYSSTGYMSRQANAGTAGTGGDKNLNNLNGVGVGGFSFKNSSGKTPFEKENRVVEFSVKVLMPTDGYTFAIKGRCGYMYGKSHEDVKIRTAYMVKLVEDYTQTPYLATLYVDDVIAGTQNFTTDFSGDDAYNIIAVKETATWNAGDGNNHVVAIDDVRIKSYKKAAAAVSPTINKSSTGVAFEGNASSLSFVFDGPEFDKESLEACSELWINNEKAEIEAAYSSDAATLVITPKAPIEKALKAKLVIGSTAKTASDMTEIGEAIEYSFLIGYTTGSHIEQVSNGADYCILPGADFTGYVILAGYTSGNELDSLSFVPVSVKAGDFYTATQTSISDKIKAFI